MVSAMGWREYIPQAVYFEGFFRGAICGPSFLAEATAETTSSTGGKFPWARNRSTRFCISLGSNISCFDLVDDSSRRGCVVSCFTGAPMFLIKLLFIIP